MSQEEQQHPNPSHDHATKAAGNKPQNNPQKKITKIVLVDAFTYTKHAGKRGILF